MAPEGSSKVTAVLVENLKEALKTVDLSFLLASLSVAFLLIHGLQGDYPRTLESEKPVEGEQARAVDEAAVRGGDDGAQVTVVPVLGLRAQLLTASLFALTLYGVFCFRAGFRVRRAAVIAERLSTIDGELLSAVLLYPSLATSSRKAKIAGCASLGVLGSAAFLLMYAGVEEIDTLLFGASLMLVPPGYLCWRLLAHHSAPLRSSVFSAATAMPEKESPQ